MGEKSLFSVMDIASTGLIAERMRMNVISNNIANAGTTKTADGTPFRRKVVIFTSELQKQLSAGNSNTEKLGGVKVKEVKVSSEPFSKTFSPGHPDADKDGFVLGSNVNGATEMVDLMTASRAYEANLAIMRSAQRMINKTIQAFKQ